MTLSLALFVLRAEFHLSCLVGLGMPLGGYRVRPWASMFLSRRFLGSYSESFAMPSMCMPLLDSCSGVASAHAARGLVFGGGNSFFAVNG